MSTTTIRLPAELKERLTRVATGLGSTPHALIIDAIAERVETEERRRDFRDTAERRYAEIAASGETLSWNEMKDYLQARIRGNDTRRPKPRKLAR